MLHLLSGFSALREGRHFYKTCGELKVSLLSIFDNIVERQRRGSEFWKALDADQKEEFLPLLLQPI